MNKPGVVNRARIELASPEPKSGVLPLHQRSVCSRKGNRTPVCTVKVCCPAQLDDAAVCLDKRNRTFPTVIPNHDRHLVRHPVIKNAPLELTNGAFELYFVPFLTVSHLAAVQVAGKK